MLLKNAAAYKRNKIYRLYHSLATQDGRWAGWDEVGTYGMFGCDYLGFSFLVGVRPNVCT